MIYVTLILRGLISLTSIACLISTIFISLYSWAKLDVIAFEKTDREKDAEKHKMPAIVTVIIFFGLSFVTSSLRTILY
jgi:uncharacterized membrane protein